MLHELHELDENDENDVKGRDHDIGAEPLITVADGEIAEAAAASGSCHRRLADEGDDDGRELAHDAGHGLRGAGRA